MFILRHDAYRGIKIYAYGPLPPASGTHSTVLETHQDSVDLSIMCEHETQLLQHKKPDTPTRNRVSGNFPRVQECRRRSPLAGPTVARGAPPACVRGTYLYPLVFRLSARLIVFYLPVLRLSVHPSIPRIQRCPRISHALLIKEVKVVKKVSHSSSPRDVSRRFPVTVPCVFSLCQDCFEFFRLLSSPLCSRPRSWHPPAITVPSSPFRGGTGYACRSSRLSEP